jgi:anaerobic dimethyl sulfoxide reductase subunit C (anchor subunit)
MNVRDWALILFTILAQMAVGSFVVLGVAYFFAARKYGVQQAERLSNWALLAIGPVMILGMLVSLLHLGNPLNAPQAVTNLGSSWLSREVFFGVLFAVLGGSFALMQWRKIGRFVVRNIIAWIAALVGLALVFCMTQVYMLETQPSWDTFATPVQFFVTTFMLGLLALGATFVANYAYVKRHDPECAEVQCSLLRSALRWIAIGAIVLLGVEQVIVPLQLTFMAANPLPQSQTSAALLFNVYVVLFVARLVLVFVGAGILGVLLYRYASTEKREALMGYLAYAAFALVLVSEVMGRFLFYSTHLRIGI